MNCLMDGAVQERVQAREPLWAGESISPADFARLRRQLVLDHCKWDPQVGDVSTLAPFPLVMGRACWEKIAADAEELARETVRAEEYLLGRPDLQRRMGVPWRLRLALRGDGARCAARVMRFDFHWTKAGWRVSEVNSDVPGGFCEGSSFTRLMADHFPGLRMAGDPGGAFARVMGRWDGVIGLLYAPGFMEDQQVVTYLAGRIDRDGKTCSRPPLCHWENEDARGRATAWHPWHPRAELEHPGAAAEGLRTILCDARQLRWRDGFAYLGDIQLGAIVRFYQGEWLAERGKNGGDESGGGAAE